MFAAASEAALQGKGVVGSTSDILSFIVARTKGALAEEEAAAAVAGSSSQSAAGARKLSFVLGTEAGMVTPIVRQVQALLRESGGGGGRGVEVEVVFPVAADAVAPQPGEDPSGGLAVVPGAGGGEGCGAAGGCATCPFMKMNSLDALMDLAGKVATAKGTGGAGEGLGGFLPLRRGATMGGRPASELGSVPILHMRSLATTGQLPPELIDDILTR